MGPSCGDGVHLDTSQDELFSVLGHKFLSPGGVEAPLQEFHSLQSKTV